jgi:fructosamine-3-kinase
MWHKMIDDIVSVGHYNEAESNYLRRLLDKYLPLFERPVASRLLHMDVWHQNILVDDSGTVTGLVDWDRALWGDPEIEFAVLDYCGISQPAFWEGYGQPRDESPAAQVRQLFYLLYELQKYIVIRHGRSHDPIAAQKYKEQVWDIGQRL